MEGRSIKGTPLRGEKDMDKSTNQMTDKDIQVLEEMRDNREALVRIYSSGTSAFSKEREERDRAEHTALTAALDYVNATREMLDAAGLVTIMQGDDVKAYIERDWDHDSNFWIVDQQPTKHDSALAAWRDGVKGEGNG